MPKSNYLSNIVLNTALRGQVYSPPATVYIALYTTAPSAGGGGVEVTGGGYTRQAVTFNVPSGQMVVSNADVIFPIAVAPWGTIVAYAIFDQGVVGNMLYFSTLSSPRAVNVTDQVRFPAGQIVCTES